MLRFKEFLLEYNEDKNWEIHGPKITSRLKSQGIEDNHKEFWNKQIQDHDPTRNKEYGQWMSKTYANGGIKHHEDIGSRVGPALEKYHKAKVSKKLASHGISADINSHKTLGHLEDSVEKLPKEEKSEKKLAEGEATKHDEKHWTVITPHTEAASKKYGRGTRWCTAADRNCMFENYHKEGPLHIYIPKNPKYPDEKYQLHGNSLSFMNEKDEPADPREVFKDRSSPHYEEHGINEKHIDSALDHESPYVRESAASSYLATPKNIEKALGDGQSKWVHLSALSNPNITTKQLDSYLKKHDIQNKVKEGKSKISYSYADAIEKYREAVINPKISDEHRVFALHHDHPDLREAAVKNPNTTEKELFDRYKNDDSFNVKGAAVAHKNFPIQHIDHVLKDAPKQVRMYLASNPNLTSKHIDSILKNHDKSNDFLASRVIQKTDKILPHHIDLALDHPDQEVREEALMHPKATTNHISRAINDPSIYVRTAAVAHPNANPEHIEQGLKDVHYHVRLAAANNPNIKPEQIDHIISRAASSNEHNDAELLKNAIRNPVFNSNHIHKILDSQIYHDDYGLKTLALRHSNANDEHVAKALNSDDLNVRVEAAIHPKASSESLMKAIHDKSRDVALAVTENPNIKKEHIDAIIDKFKNIKNPAHYEKMLNHKEATHDHIKKALDSNNYYLQRAAVGSHLAKKEDLSYAIDKNPEIHQHILNRRDLHPDHIHQILSKGDVETRINAARHPNADSRNLDKALSDPEQIVRNHAIRNPNISEKNFAKAIHNDSENIRNEVAFRTKSSETISKALKDQSPYVRASALHNPNITKEHLQQAKKHETHVMNKELIADIEKKIG